MNDQDTSNVAASNAYPFRTKKEVAEDVASGDPVIVSAYVRLMQDRTDRRDADPTIKRCGWMSSHDKRGRTIGPIAQTGECLEGENLAVAREIISTYVKQIATELRANSIAANPALQEAASVFGVG